VIKTIRNLPEPFSKQVDVTVNDWEFDVVAHNIIILLLVFTSLDDTSLGPTPYFSIAEALIHVWYSAFVPPDLLSSLQNKVGNMLRNNCTHTTEVTQEGALRKTWLFSRERVLSVTLGAEQWPQLEAFLHVPAGLTKQSAQKTRAAVVMSPERADYRDRWYFKDAYPSMRLAKQQFRNDGLLLPFGHPRNEFIVPNP
jgi:hypothetical protein